MRYLPTLPQMMKQELLPLIVLASLLVCPMVYVVAVDHILVAVPEVPDYPNATGVRECEIPDDSHNAYYREIEFTTSDKPEQIYGLYRRLLSQTGWDTSEEFCHSNMFRQAGLTTTGGRFFVISITAVEQDHSKTRVTIVVVPWHCTYSNCYCEPPA